MYESFYRFSLDPFRMGPDHDLCYVHRSYGKAKAYLRYALLQREGFVMVTGESGTGKTTLIGELLAELDSQEYVVARLATAQLAGRDLVRSVAYALALSAEGLDQATLLRDIGRYLDDQHRAGKRVLLVVDEAQDLEMGALTELRLLANAQNGSELLLQIFLVGQDTLASRVRRADMQQFHQRIIAACHLEPLSRDETRGYIEHRLRRAGWQGDPRIGLGVFTAVHRFSRGVPRRINLTMSRLLLHGWSEERHALTGRDVELTIAELRRENLAPVELAGKPSGAPGSSVPIRTLPSRSQPVRALAGDVAPNRGGTRDGARRTFPAGALDADEGGLDREPACPTDAPVSALVGRVSAGPGPAPSSPSPELSGPTSSLPGSAEMASQTVGGSTSGTQTGLRVEPSHSRASRHASRRRHSQVRYRVGAVVCVTVALLGAGVLGYSANRANKPPSASLVTASASESPVEVVAKDVTSRLGQPQPEPSLSSRGRDGPSVAPPSPPVAPPMPSDADTAPLLATSRASDAVHPIAPLETRPREEVREPARNRGGANGPRFEGRDPVMTVHGLGQDPAGFADPSGVGLDVARLEPIPPQFLPQQTGRPLPPVSQQSSWRAVIHVVLPPLANPIVPRMKPPGQWAEMSADAGRNQPEPAFGGGEGDGPGRTPRAGVAQRRP